MSRKFSFGHAVASKWEDAAETCLSQFSELGRPNLGFVYLNDEWVEYIPEITEFFRQRAGVEHWVGTGGMCICATGKEYFDRAAMAVMVGEFEDGSFSVFSGINRLENVAIAKLECGGRPGYFGVVHGDPYNADMVDLVKGVASKTESGFLVGGLPYSRKENFQVADGMVSCGLSGVLFSKDVAVTTRLTQGCTPIGPVHAVTEVFRRNILISLDDKPALDVFREDIGEVLSRDLDRASGFIFAGLPTMGSDKGDYIVRNVAGVDVQNKYMALGLTICEELSVGSRVMFCRRDAHSAREDMIRMLAEIKRDIKGSPRGGLYFSCMGRGSYLFGKNSEELGMIRHELGDFPLVGIFCNGEISHDRLYAFTGVLTLFV